MEHKGVPHLNRLIRRVLTRIVYSVRRLPWTEGRGLSVWNFPKNNYAKLTISDIIGRILRRLRLRVNGGRHHHVNHRLYLRS